MNTTFERSTNSKDEWLTPQPIVRQLGPFDLDPCAPVKRPWETAKRHFTIEDDGLKQIWTGYVWLNPPYGNVAPKWLQRLAAHNHGIALIPARTETRMFFDFVWPIAEAVMFIRRRIHFFEHLCECGAPHSKHDEDFHCRNYRATGKIIEGGQSGSPPMLIAYGQFAAQKLFASDIIGKFVPLKLRFELKTTWRKLIRFILQQADGICSLDELYAEIGDHPKAATNPNWKAKVRQIVQQEGHRIGPATWQLTLATA